MDPADPSLVKKVKGRKCQIAVDVEGQPIVIGLHPVEVQD